MRLFMIVLISNTHKSLKIKSIPFVSTLFNVIEHEIWNERENCWNFFCISVALFYDSCRGYTFVVHPPLACAIQSHVCTRTKTKTIATSSKQCCTRKISKETSHIVENECAIHSLFRPLCRRRRIKRIELYNWE